MVKHSDWHIPVSLVLDEAVESAIKDGQYISKSDLIREAVRSKLVKLGYSVSGCVNFGNS